MSYFSNHLGERYGSLVIVANTKEILSGHVLWLCQCDCGGTVKRLFRSLKYAKKAGCPACYSTRISSWRTGMATTTRHGDTKATGKAPLYHIWKGMRERCGSPKSDGYKYYGAKGIQVCAAWQVYENFRLWARANNYRTGLSIDRINPEGNYEPANCEWVTPSENSKRNIHHQRQKKAKMTCQGV